MSGMRVEREQCGTSCAETLPFKSVGPLARSCRTTLALYSAGPGFRLRFLPFLPVSSGSARLLPSQSLLFTHIMFNRSATSDFDDSTLTLANGRARQTKHLFTHA